MWDLVQLCVFFIRGIRYEEIIKIFALGIWSRMGYSVLLAVSI